MACQCLTSQCRRPSWNHFAYERAGKALDAKRDISSQKKQSFAPNRFSGPRWYTFDRFGYIRKTNSLRFHRPYQRLCRSRWEWSDAAPPASSLSLGPEATHNRYFYNGACWPPISTTTLHRLNQHATGHCSDCFSFLRRLGHQQRWWDHSRGPVDMAVHVPSCRAM